MLIVHSVVFEGYFLGVLLLAIWELWASGVVWIGLL